MLKFKDYCVSAILSLLLYGGLMSLLILLITPDISLLIPIAIGITVVVLNAVSLKKLPWLLPTVCMSLFVLCIGILWGKAIDGMAGFFNEFIDTFKQVHAKNYEIFVVSEPQNLLVTFTLVSALLALVCAQAIKRRSVLFAIISSAVIVCSIIVYLPILSVAWLIIASVTLFLVWFVSTIYKVQSVEFSVKWITLKTFLRSGIALLLIVLVGVSLFGTAKPKGVQQIASDITEFSERLIYGSVNDTGLTQGDLSKVGKKKTSNDVMLKVTMSVPTSYYLRGFIGEIYEENQWKTLSQSVLYENSDIFANLHQNGFFAQGQLARAASMADEGLIGYENTVVVENVGLPSKYLYAPYELMDWSTILDSQMIGDHTVYSSGFAGQRNYQFAAADNLIVSYQKIAATLYEKQKEGTQTDYLNTEASYNQFVYEQYTSLPSDIDSYLSKKLGNYIIDEGQVHFDYQKAKQNILYYLTENITYSEDVLPAEDGIDFILNFLDGTRSGYDVHYASAATMMFRYYGIPARFAEGYIITKDEAKNAIAGEPLLLDNTHAHAWVEYYQDGVGWLPFEVTPTYLSVMEQPDTYKDISGLIGQAPEDEIVESLQPDQVTEDENPTLLSFWLKNRLIIVLVLAFCAVALLILLFVLWLIRERKKTAKRKAGFLSDDLHMAICSIFEYIIDISIANGLKPDNRPAAGYVDFFDEDLREDYRQVVQIWQEARFSENPMEEQQRTRVISLKDVLWQRVWNRAGLLEKLQLKFLYFL